MHAPGFTCNGYGNHPITRRQRGFMLTDVIPVLVNTSPVQILAVSDESLAGKMKEFKENMAREIEKKDAQLQDTVEKDFN